MRPEFNRLAASTFDLLIVGGGITGACIARDAAFRGLRVALVEQGDFAQATTAASSKLIHGGLRYLQNLELGFVRQGLRERRTWSNIAPHMVDPLPFLMPTTAQGMKKRAILHLALSAYDLLGYDRNRLEDPDKGIPAHGNLSREEVLSLEPALAALQITGAMRFHDCQMYSPERLALECVLDARDAGAVVLNHTGATGFLREGQRITGALLRPAGASQQEPPIPVRAALTVNAAGPWADILMGALSETPAARRLIRSKGIHLITRPLTQGHAIAIQTPGGHFFLLPWRGHTLIGTTDTVFEGDPSEVNVTEDDIAGFLAVVNQGLPSARITRQDVLHFYGGLRPIVENESGGCGAGAGSYGASRAPEVYDHASHHGLEGVITAIGGKWTTSRALAEDVVDMALRKLGRAPVAATTADRPTRGGHTGRFTAYAEAACQAHPNWPAATIEHLVKNYGSRYEDVLQIAEAEPALAAPLGARFPDIGAQVAYAVREELACNLDDVLFRRTGLGTLGHPGEDTLASVVAILAAALGWDGAEQARQLERLPRYFVPQASPVIAAA